MLTYHFQNLQFAKQFWIISSSTSTHDCLIQFITWKKSFCFKRSETIFTTSMMPWSICWRFNVVLAGNNWNFTFFNLSWENEVVLSKNKKAFSFWWTIFLSSFLNQSSNKHNFEISWIRELPGLSGLFLFSHHFYTEHNCHTNLGVLSTTAPLSFVKQGLIICSFKRRSCSIPFSNLKQFFLPIVNNFIR